jgi:hypothetical protein
MQEKPILKNKLYLYLTEFFSGMAVMAVVHRLILRGQVVALSASCVAVAGSTLRAPVASLFVATTIRELVTTTAASALPVQLSSSQNVVI